MKNFCKMRGEELAPITDRRGNPACRGGVGAGRLRFRFQGGSIRFRNARCGDGAFRCFGRTCRRFPGSVGVDAAGIAVRAPAGVTVAIAVRRAVAAGIAISFAVGLPVPVTGVAFAIGLAISVGVAVAFSFAVGGTVGSGRIVVAFARRGAVRTAGAGGGTADGRGGNPQFCLFPANGGDPRRRLRPIHQPRSRGPYGHGGRRFFRHGIAGAG